MKRAKNIIIADQGLQEIISIFPTLVEDFDYLIWFKDHSCEYYWKHEIIIEGQ